MKSTATTNTAGGNVAFLISKVSFKMGASLLAAAQSVVVTRKAQEQELRVTSFTRRLEARRGLGRFGYHIVLSKL